MMGSTVRFRESAYPYQGLLQSFFAHDGIVPPPQPVPSALRGSENSFGTLNFLTSDGFQPTATVPAGSRSQRNYRGRECRTQDPPADRPRPFRAGPLDRPRAGAARD